MGFLGINITIPPVIQNAVNDAGKVVSGVIQTVANSIPSGDQTREQAALVSGVYTDLSNGLSTLPLPGADLFKLAPQLAQFGWAAQAGAQDAARMILGADQNSRNPFTDAVTATLQGKDPSSYLAAGFRGETVPTAQHSLPVDSATEKRNVMSGGQLRRVVTAGPADVSAYWPHFEGK